MLKSVFGKSASSEPARSTTTFSARLQKQSSIEKYYLRTCDWLQLLNNQKNTTTMQTNTSSLLMAAHALAMRGSSALRPRTIQSSWQALNNFSALRNKSTDHFRPLYSASLETDRQRSIRDQLNNEHSQKRWANTSSGFYAPFILDRQAPAHHIQQAGPSSVLEDNENLPSLHVPNLTATLEALKESISPVAMNSAEFVNTLRLIDEFAQFAGPKLDILLRNKAEQTKNWLTLDGWWTNEIYLKSRKPLVINSNPSMIYPPLPFEVANQLALVSTISQLVSALIDFRQALVHGYNPEATSADNECRLDPNLCYGQYKHMFGSTRMPASLMDQHSLKYLSPDTSAAFTIVISYRGKFFEIQLKDIDNERSRTDQIAGILDKIIATGSTESESGGASPSRCLNGVGVLTTANRDLWADSIKLLDADSVEAIREAQFVVCIDTIPSTEGTSSSDNVSSSTWSFSSSLLDAPQGSEQHLAALGRQVLHGDGTNIGNRWFDKAFQLIVVADSKAERLLGAGINYEHSFAEGTVITKMIEYSYDKTVAKNRESSQMNYFKEQQFSSQEPALFRQLRMYDESRSGEISGLLEKTKLDYQSQVDQFDLAYFKYKQYGSNAIKSWRFSPDSWFQVALQSAFFNIHQRLGPCYESASTRRFAMGRTETIRSLTKEVAHYCQDPSFETLAAAVKSHKSYSTAASHGDAIDRALFGYKMTFNELRSNSWKWGLPTSSMADGRQLPESLCRDLSGKSPSDESDGSEQSFKLEDLFSEEELNTIVALFNNELIQRSIRFALSTSQVSSIHPNIYMAYGPLKTDGYGCCYNITGQQVVAAITANSSNPAFSCDVHKLNESLADSMDKMRDLIENH